MTRGIETAERDRDLVARYLAARDEVAFRGLYAAHTPYLWAFALRLTGGRVPEAEDVIQETWLTAVRRLPGFRWESAFRTWLCGIGLNCWRSARRRTLREVTAGSEETVSEVPRDPGDAVDLERAIAALPDGYRAVLVLYGLHGYTHAEIADRLGIAEGTSKSQLARARKALEATLGQGSEKVKERP